MLQRRARRPLRPRGRAVLVAAALLVTLAVPAGAVVARSGTAPDGVRAAAARWTPPWFRPRPPRPPRPVPPRPTPPATGPTAPAPGATGTAPPVVPPTSTTAPGTTPTGGTTGSPTGGTTGGATGSPTGGTTSPGGATSGPATGTGVAFDPRLVPAGARGSDQYRVVRTGEQPTASGDGTGNFRTVCQYSHMNTDDPIVAPMRLGASHLHVFWGNTGTDATSTAQSIATTGRSTCRGGTANRTAYWAPAVIDTRDGAPQAPDLVHVYYKSGYYGLAPQDIRPLPDGLRMIAGSSSASGPQQHAGWRCWNAGSAVQATIPRCAPGDFVTMTLDFPQCWNGRDLDAPDHKSHMAYPSGGRCPASHPVAVPVISYNVLYPVTAATDTSRWRLSSDTYAAGLPGGYSVHGDWFDGWDPALKPVWTDGCVRRPVTCGSHLLGDGRAMQGDA